MLTIATGSKKEIRCLEVKVGKNVHTIPLGADLPVKFAFELRKTRKMPVDERGSATFDVLADFVVERLGDDAAELTIGDLSTIINAWSDASSEDGVDAGE